MTYSWSSTREFILKAMWPSPLSRWRAISRWIRGITDEALEAAAIRSVLGQHTDPSNWRRRPFRSPHHTASPAALVGGGRGPAPGEISRAHNGVLFLDELPEFSPQVLDSLRQPLEAGAASAAFGATKRAYAAHGQKYEPVDHHLILSYKEAREGQILEEGITEAGSMASFTAAGTSYAYAAQPMIPFLSSGTLIWMTPAQSLTKSSNDLSSAPTAMPIRILV